MTIRETIEAFFHAENRRDWSTYEALVDPEVEAVSFGPPGRESVRGRVQFVEEVKRAYGDRPSTFTVVHLLTDERQNLAIAEIEIEGRRSVDVFELRHGRIWREREYFDDAYWTR